MKIKQRKKKFSGLVALMMCFVFAFVGQSSAEEFGWPTPNCTTINAAYTYPSSGNRHRCRYSTPDGRAAGVDINVGLGTEIYAPAAGTVQKMYYQSNGFGNHFEILHDDGTITLYAHLSAYKVQNGQRVNRGDLIALSGNSGGDYGYHLHYEMYNPNIGLDTYQYYKNNGYRDPRTMSDERSDPKYSVSPGLADLTSSRYAKTYTLTSGHYKVYKNSDLTVEDSNHWTGYDEEDYITGVGFNSSGEAYAQVQIPTNGGGRLTVYVRLHDVFVPGTLTESGTAVNKSGGLYKRKNDGYHSNWWIDPGDTVYLLTEADGFCQVMYPISGYNYWRIAWLTRRDYDYVMGKETPSGDDSNARDKVVAYAWEIYNYKWYAFQPILRHQGELLGPMWIRGIPYTLYGTGDTFEQYKELIDKNNSGVNNDLYDTVTYQIWTGATRTSMKHGMACATFVTTCIMQGFPKSAGLSMQSAIKFHTKDGWRNYITQGNKDYSGYANLQKGDYLDNFSSHVILVVGNHVGSGNGDSYIEYIDQTPTYVEDNDVGTHKGTYDYSTLYSSGYSPMYVNYPHEEQGIPIDAQHFPDSYFREYVKNFDTNGNGYFSQSELDAVTEMWEENGPHPDNGNPSNGNYGYEWIKIESIEGIKYFRNLKKLCVYRDNIKEIDLSGMEHLEMLYCYGNTKNEGYGNKLTKLNLKNCASLKELRCENNQIQTLELEGCTALRELQCQNNQLKTLNLKGCKSLYELYASNNKLTGINVDGCTSLQYLYLGKNSFKELKLSRMSSVIYITAHENPALKCVYVDNNPTLRTLVLYDCPALERVYAENSRSIRGINIDGDTNLRIFNRAKNVTVPGSKPTITTSSLPDAVVGKIYNVKVSAKSNALTCFSVNSVVMSNGISFDITKYYSPSKGTVTAPLYGKVLNRHSTYPKTITVIVTAENYVGETTKNFTLTIREDTSKYVPKITSNAISGKYYTGTYYDIPFTASGASPIT